ncbi:Rhodopsin, GQ-coupled [Folsomia candida]|uniref:Rhodopsin, GQ-coupled n=1 Tax=Folsomia candida TaxID=158441 RepID=A0A226ES00_FOLCA|nr:Rhodopsin, GQ-coupled [Folsomia candida]
MLHLILGSLGTLMSFFGIFTNLYVLVVLLRNKKARTSNEWILLHLSSCGLTASLTNLLCIGPSVFLEKWITASGSSMVSVGCDVTGAATLSLQLLIVWSICALSADRCAAIVSPLRYTQVITRRKIAAFFLSVWIITISVVLVSFFIKPAELQRHQSGTITTEVAGVTTLGGRGIPHIVPVWDHRQTLGPGDEASVTPYFPTTTIVDLDNPRSTEEDNDDVLSNTATMGYISTLHDVTTDHLLLQQQQPQQQNASQLYAQGPFQYRPLIGVCLPKLSSISVLGALWVSGWIILILIAPMVTILICDFTVLSIARRQRHRIIMALYQITAVTQVTVTGSKGAPLPGLWLNRSVPARSRACRAVWEDMMTLLVLHVPLILIFILESTLDSHSAPFQIDTVASLSLFLTPSLTGILYGIRARPLRTASPVDGSPRLSGSRLKSFRSSSPSPNSSPTMTPQRRQSTNDLRPPPFPLAMSISPSHGHLGNHHHHHAGTLGNQLNGGKRKVRSFLHLPSQVDMQEFWSGMRRPNRSPTIVITHEIRLKDSSSSLCSQLPSPAAEQRL